MERGGGGGGVNERFWPINGLKCLLNGWFKKKGKLMAGSGNEGFATDERGREMNSATCKFLQAAKFTKFHKPVKFSQPRKFPGRK